MTDSSQQSAEQQREPQETGKAEPDMRAICEALGFDPTNHHNAAKCPYCRPPESKEAGKVEVVADEPVAFYECEGDDWYVYRRGSSTYEHIRDHQKDRIGVHVFALYLRPSQQALISDETIESLVVEKLGTPDSFPAGEYYSGTMEKMVELARAILAAAGENK